MLNVDTTISREPSEPKHGTLTAVAYCNVTTYRVPTACPAGHRPRTRQGGGVGSRHFGESEGAIRVAGQLAAEGTPGKELSLIHI